MNSTDYQFEQSGTSIDILEVPCPTRMCFSNKVIHVACYWTIEPLSCNYNIFCANDRIPIPLTSDNHIFQILHIQWNSSIHLLLLCQSTSCSLSWVDRMFHRIHPLHMHHSIHTKFYMLDYHANLQHRFYFVGIENCNISFLFFRVEQAEKPRIRLPAWQKAGALWRMWNSFCRRKMPIITSLGIDESNRSLHNCSL